MILYDPIPYAERNVMPSHEGIINKIKSSPRLDKLLESYELRLDFGNFVKTGYHPGQGILSDAIAINPKQWPLAILHEISHYIVAPEEDRQDSWFNIELPVIDNNFYVSEETFLEETKARYVDLCLMAMIGIRKKWRKHHLTDIKYVLSSCWELFQQQMQQLLAENYRPPTEYINSDDIRQTNHLIESVLG